jgi:hypothetical protein
MKDARCVPTGNLRAEAVSVRPVRAWFELNVKRFSGVRRPAGAVHFPASLAPVRSGSREVSEKFANKITKIQK